MDARQKLKLLADASRYDLSCACGTTESEHRRRGPDGLWLYPASLPGGGVSILLKTLLSSHCTNDCRYCPLRSDRDIRRCVLAPEQVARIFMDYVRRQKIFGLFLSSGVMRDADTTMARMTAVAEILRGRYGYRGYIHLKIIPAASDAAIERALSLASAVSLNVEVPTASAMAKLSGRKVYDRDIVRPMKLISRLTARGRRYARVKQTTQFIVGAAGEKDRQIVQATFGLYKRLRLNRVYFSAYQRGLGDPTLPGEQYGAEDPAAVLTREHRLYQVDWLLRKYGFKDEEIPFLSDGNLSLAADPKWVWAQQHRERFPLDINQADKYELLRVPGFGLVTVNRILKVRSGGGKIRRLEQLGRVGKRLGTARPYVKFGD